jgi:hypothetical protein
MACELAEQLLSLAQRVQDPVLLLEAHDALGQTFSCLARIIHERSAEGRTCMESPFVSHPCDEK